MQTCWLDTNGCPESFHEIKRVDGNLEVFHGDGTPCEVTEFNFKNFPPIEDVQEMGRLARETSAQFKTEWKGWRR